MSDRDASVDDLAVLQIFRIESAALSIECRSRNQRIVDVKGVLGGDSQSRVMSLNRERHG
jgi:hypothetical protein